jgi:hypothetical protein
MDPLTAISLASSIAQFVHFGLSFCSLTRKIYHAGSGEANLDLQIVTGDIIRVNERLKADQELPAPIGCHTREEAALLELVNECLTIGNELKDRLSDLHLDGERGKWKSIRQAMKTIWNREKLDDLATRLQAFRAQLQFHHIASLKQATEDDIAQRNDRLAKLQANDREIINAIDQHSLKILARLDAQQRAAAKDLHRATQRDSDMILSTLKMLRENKIVQAPSLDEITRQKVLSTLYFRHQSLRFDQVGANHPQTCEWIFRRSINNCASQIPFVDWLESGYGCYWISGKAGSGKSTLMKYICGQRRTADLLSTWADQNYLIIATFFFWNAGTPEQKSQVGLLRALLYQILRARPDLTELILPGMFEATMAYRPDAVELHESELRAAFESLAELTKATGVNPDFVPLRICLIVDGIDEFEGDPAIIANLFRRISDGTGVKILTSGRPLPYQSAFVDYPQIKVQDLTYDDIKQYVHDHFSDDVTLQALAINDVEALKDLVEDIIDKADGVFLWVILVVASLLNGIQGADSIEDLQETLHRLPEDLEKLYEHIFSRLDERYRRQASQYFAMARYHGEMYPEKVLTTLTLSYMETGETSELLNTPRGFFSEEACLRRCKVMETRISNRCLGLLEVHHWRAPQDHASTSSPLVYSTVHYLHKSLTDFLYQEKYWGPIKEQSGLSTLDLEIRMCRSHLFHQKQYLWWEMVRSSRHKDFDEIAPLSITDYERSPQSSARPLWKPLGYLLELIRAYESRGRFPEPEIIEETIRIILGSCHSIGGYKVQGPTNQGVFKQGVFRDPTDVRNESQDKEVLRFAIQAGFFTVVERQLEKNIFDGGAPGRSPFHLFLALYSFEEEWQAPLHTYLPICTALIKAGGSPKDDYGAAAWLQILRKFQENERTLSRDSKNSIEVAGRELDEVMMLFIDHGADLARPVNKSSRAWDLLPLRLKERIPQEKVPNENEIQKDWVFVECDIDEKIGLFMAEQSHPATWTVEEVTSSLLALGVTAVDVTLKGIEAVAAHLRDEVRN